MMMIGKHAREAGYGSCSVCNRVTYFENEDEHLCGRIECYKTFERVKRFVCNQEQIQAVWRDKGVKPTNCVFCDGTLVQGFKMRILCDDYRCGLDYSRLKRQIKKYSL